MDASLYFSFAVASAVILVVPGPTIITVISQSANHGRSSTFPLIFGVFMGDLAAMSLSLLGLGAILQTSALLFSVLKWAGAAYLVYLGLKTWLKKETVNANEGKVNQLNGYQLFRSSFFVTILNPKSIAFFVAFFPQFINPNEIVYRQFLILGATFLVLAVANASLYSIFATRLGYLLKKDRIQKWFKRASGSVLVGAGIITVALKES